MVPGETKPSAALKKNMSCAGASTGLESNTENMRSASVVATLVLGLKEMSSSPVSAPIFPAKYSLHRDEVGGL